MYFSRENMSPGKQLWQVQTRSSRFAFRNDVTQNNGYVYEPGYETDDPLYIILHGELGSSSPLKLSEAEPLSDRFDIFPVEEHIGNLVSVEVFKEGTDDWVGGMMLVSTYIEDELVTYDFIRPGNGRAPLEDMRQFKPIVLSSLEGLRKQLYPIYRR